MSKCKIKIETLSPVHIGSGIFLQRGNDFVCGKSEEGDDIIAIINLKKVLKLIGEDNISTWVLGIEKGRPVDEIVRQFAPKAKLEDYADRIIMRWSDKSTETLKEFIHDGLGRPYIPGSSIKGAIRTAILSSIIDTIPQKEDKIISKKDYNRFEKNKISVSAKEIEAFAFGKDPQEDVFRYLQVGDAIFGKLYEAATRLVNINERYKHSYWDESKSQLVEVLVDGDTAYFDMKLCPSNNPSHPLPSCMIDLTTMLSTINNHTLSLIDKEITYWEERSNDKNAQNVDLYVKKLRVIESKAIECQKKTGACVMRIGHGSGWRFITGAWAEKLANYDLVIQNSRPGNNKYEKFNFPKSRRVDDECELLGFVLLSVT